MAIHINEMSITHLSRVLGSSGFSRRVWLQDLIVDQARWHAKQPLAGGRGTLYRWMANPLIGLAYKMAAKKPLRLLLVNEMFAVAWQHSAKPPIPCPVALTERAAIGLSES